MASLIIAHFFKSESLSHWAVDTLPCLCFTVTTVAVCDLKINQTLPIEKPSSLGHVLFLPWRLQIFSVLGRTNIYDG